MRRVCMVGGVIAMALLFLWVGLSGLAGTAEIKALRQHLPQPPFGSTAAISPFANGNDACPRPYHPPHVTKHVTPWQRMPGEVVTVTYTIHELNVRPVDVVLVLDVTRSMGQTAVDGKTRFEVAQEDALAFLGQLAPQDRVGLITFSNVIATEHLMAEKEVIANRIANLTPSDSNATQIDDALQAAYTELITTGYAAETMKGIVLFSDAPDNLSDETRTNSFTWAQAAEDCGVPTYAFDYGTTAPADDFLSDLATGSGGAYFSVPTASVEFAQTYDEIKQQVEGDLEIKEFVPTGLQIDCAAVPAAWACSSGDPLILTHTVPAQAITTPQTTSYTAVVTFDPGPMLQQRSRFHNSDSCLSYTDRFPDKPACVSIPAPAPVCVYTADSYEDDPWDDEHLPFLLTDTPQLHNFAKPGDVDWIQFTRRPDTIYTVTTEPLSDTMANRHLTLYRLRTGGSAFTDLITLTTDINKLHWGMNHHFYLPLIMKDATSAPTTLPIIRYQPSATAVGDSLYLSITSTQPQVAGCDTRYYLSLEMSP